jgi:hypothetical protein
MVEYNNENNNNGAGSGGIEMWVPLGFDISLANLGTLGEGTHNGFGFMGSREGMWPYLTPKIP